MSEHLRCILESKRALRTRPAALPFVERFRCWSNSGTALCDSTLQPPRLVAHNGANPFPAFLLRPTMKASSPASFKRKPTPPGDSFFAQANAAMRKAARQVAAENKLLGLPLIAIKSKP